MALTFVCRDLYVSRDRRADGTLVAIPHGWTTRYDFDDATVRELWALFPAMPVPARLCSCGCGSTWDPPRMVRDVEAFREHLRTRLTNPDDADDVMVCDRCEDPGTGDDFYTTGEGDTVCDDCYSNSYYQCGNCDESYRSTTTTLSGGQVCEGCRDNYYSFCDECDGYYHVDYGCEGEHSNGCECEAPAQFFTMRNDGDPALANDTRAVVTLPAGTISPVGIGTIANLLREQRYALPLDECGNYPKERNDLWSLSYELHEIGDVWQTKQGNYTKRLSRHAYKRFGLKLSQDVLSRVGCIARDHSTAVDFAVEMTRDLNMSAEDFYHEDSCWWGGYSESRCALKSNGGFGMRTFDGDEVTGRAWVMPMRDEDGTLVPTFDTATPDAFVVFNGYGALGGYVPARILAHMAGMTYRKIGFSCSPMYVNNDTGYLVTREDLAARYEDGSLRLSVDMHSDLYATERTPSYV